MEICIVDRREKSWSWSWSRERIDKDDGRDVDFRKRELDSAAPPSVWVDRVCCVAGDCRSAEESP